MHVSESTGQHLEVGTLPLCALQAGLGAFEVLLALLQLLLQACCLLSGGLQLGCSVFELLPGFLQLHLCMCTDVGLA